ncbi:MAG: ABC transporter permease [Bacteroidota bacterium]
MKNIWILARREFQTFFDSMVAYILLVAFLIFTGLFTWVTGGMDVFYIQQANLVGLFQWASIIFVVFIPALTMRMVAEEKKTGTLEVLLTRAVSDWEIISGKYLACLMLVGVALLFTLPYYFTVAYLGPVDHGATICGYLGMMLVASAYIGIGLFASSLTSNQFVAFVVAILINLLFLFLFGILSDTFSGVAAEVLNYMGFNTRFSSIARGVIDSRDIIYFLSLTALGLVLAESQLARRNVID